MYDTRLGHGTFGLPGIQPEQKYFLKKKHLYRLREKIVMITLGTVVYKTGTCSCQGDVMIATVDDVVVIAKLGVVLIIDVMPSGAAKVMDCEGNLWLCDRTLFESSEISLFSFQKE